MKNIRLNSYTITALSLILGTLTTVPANSQPITPAKDGTGTTINRNGNNFNIQGGTRSGTNLFHSFGKFNVNSGQTANFLTTPDTRNILGRVTGGNASIINGLIQVIGSNSNLFLMNPAGIMFGPNATLNIPASFSVTTATGIGFNNNNFWFKAMGTNDYSNLVGQPSGYHFNMANPGAIVNQGDLSLNPGENLTLLGGTVINTGQLSTPGGKITIAAVEGGSTLRISQPGHLLNLEVGTLHGTSLQNGQDISELTPLSLAELLTGGEIAHATSVIVNNNGDVVLTNSNTLVADTPGTAVISGNIDVSIPPNPPYEGGDMSSLPLRKGDGRGIGSQVNVLGDRVALLNTNINTDGLNGGGTVLIGGDFQGNGIVPNSQQTFVNNGSVISANAITNGDGGRVIIWSDGITDFAGNISAKGGEFSGNGGFVEVSGKQELIFDGNVDVTAALGNPGTILLDPENIILGGAESNTSLENSQGNIILQADNDITINENIETTESVELKAGRSININADIDTSSGNGNIDILGNNDEMNIANRSEGKASINQKEETTLNAGSGNINIELGNLGEVGEINLENLTTTGGNIQVYSGGKITVRGDISTTLEGGNAGNITINSFNGEIDTSESFIGATAYDNSSPEEPSQSVKGGDISISASGDIKTGGIDAGSSNEAGNITIESRNGSIDTSEGYIGASANSFGDLEGSSQNAKAGDISISASGDIKTGGIDAGSSNEAGNITIESHNGSIDTSEGYIGASAYDYSGPEETSQNATGGDISISASGDIKTGGIDTGSSNEAGNITIESQNGSIDTSEGSIRATADIFGDLEGSSQNAKGGDISISASGDIKTGGIDTGSANEGGNITITSSSGEVLTTGSVIRTSSSNPEDQSVTTLQGGDIEITANGNINSSAFITSGVEAGGDITLTSFNGSVINSNLLDSSSKNGIAGNITVNSEALMILAGQINTTGNTQGGNINLTSNSSDVDTNAATIQQTSANGTDGNLNITANTGSIEIGEISGSRNITIADGGESDPFSNDPNTDISSDANQVDRQSGEVHLQAHNDITINEPINATEISQLELRAGRNINLNANIDTSSSNGNIKLRANDQGADLQYRGEGTGNITMAANTTINAGGGEISIELGNLAEVGDITLSHLQTTGNIIVDANGGNIFRSSENSLITSGNSVFKAPTGSIGTETEPLNISVENLEARSGRGVFFYSPTQGVNIGNASNILPGIYTSSGGEIKVEALGDITVTETVFTASFDQKAGDITLNSREGAIDTTAAPLNSSSIQRNSGNITLTAPGNINTGNIGSSSFEGDTGNISITSFRGDVDTTSGFIRFPSREGNSGNVRIFAFGDIKTGDIISNDIFLSQGGDGGDITITSINGAVDTTDGRIGSYANNGNAGDVVISAFGDIQTGDINTYSGTGGNNNSNSNNSENPNENGNNNSSSNIQLGEGNGGNVTINSRNGAVDTTEGWISTSSDSKAGDVEISASGDINTGSIDSYSNDGQGGNITINSRNGAVDTTGDFSLISSYSFNGSAGNIEISAFGDINTGSIDSYSNDGQGGNITINSDNGAVNTIGEFASISSYSNNGTAGNINISASGDINTGFIFSDSFEGEDASTSSGEGNGGNITINSRNGAVDTTKGSIGTSADGKAGNVEISASGDINTEYISSFSFLEGGQGGDISIKSRNGAINTTGDSAFFGEPLKPDAKITSEDVATRFRETPANLDAYAPEGTGGNITLSAQGDITIYEVSSYGGNISGDVNITSTTGNINTDVIFSTGSIERGGNISIQTPGNIDINHIVTYSENGIGGEINLNAGGNVTINNIASFGITDSGDVSIQSNSGNIETKNIDTLAEDGISGNITLNDFGTQGNISTANINTKGGTEAGGIEITATDGSILTGDLESSSLSGNAGGIILEALTNIETGSQTVIAGIGDASISNNAGNNINVGNQTAMTESGNAMIINNAGNNITTGNQIAVTNDGISIIENNAPGNISTGTVTQLGNNIQSTTSTIAAIEQNRNNEFANYLGLNLSPQVTSTKNVREVLTDIARQTDNNSAIIYVTAYPEALQLILYTPGSDPILKTIPDANREELMKAVLQLRAQITSPARRFTDSYLPPAQQLYDWLIAPLSAELAAANIDTLLFSMDEGLRTLPVATLHDGEQFLIEKYSLSLIPSISLMDTNYQSLHNTQVLAMGASEFIQQGALPAVPVELETISQKLWQGSTFINENFTRDNLLTQRQNYPYPIIHLATHAEFKPGKANNSYIQLWGNEQLHLDEMRELGWNEPPVELLVLSACRTAFGDKNAELGFAGLAVAAGVKSALASIWYVSDEGTLGLMTEFYIHLNNAKIKAEALRQAQLAMLRGEVVITEGKLRVPGIRGAVVLPSVLGKFSNQNLSHPYYWAGFMMVGSPW